MKALFFIFTLLFLNVSFGQSSSEVMLKLFNMKTSNDLIINVPETLSKSVLAEFVNLGTIEYVKGTYSYNKERGNVLLDYKKINALTLNETKGEYYFVIPFMVNNQGSGIFNYLGFFVSDSKMMTVKHIDSYYLGDRIKVEKIRAGGNEVYIFLKSHSNDQAMAKSPNSKKTIYLKVNKKGFLKQSYKMYRE